MKNKIKHSELKELNYNKYISSSILEDTTNRRPKPKRSSVDPKVARFTKNKMLSNMNEYSKNYRIALLSRGQMFGDQDVFFDRPYQTTVT